MAVAAIFQDRRMLPEEGPASFGMACVTIFIDAVLPELRWVGATVRIMAVGANDFALAEWHMG